MNWKAPTLLTFLPKLAGFSWPPDQTLYQCSGKAVHGGEMYSKILWTYSQLISVPFNGRYPYKNISYHQHHLLTNSWLIQAEDIPPPKKKHSAELEVPPHLSWEPPGPASRFEENMLQGMMKWTFGCLGKVKFFGAPNGVTPGGEKSLQINASCEDLFIQTWQVFFNLEMLRVMKNVTEPYNLPPFTSKIQTSADFTVMLSAWIQLGLWGNFQHWKRPEVWWVKHLFLRWGILYEYCSHHSRRWVISWHYPRQSLILQQPIWVLESTVLVFL